MPSLCKVVDVKSFCRLTVVIVSVRPLFTTASHTTKSVTISTAILPFFRGAVHITSLCNPLTGHCCVDYASLLFY